MFKKDMEAIRGRRPRPGSATPSQVRAVLFVLLAALAIPALATPARAALRAKDSVSLEETWNPAPAEGDIILPMPCGLGMVFRIIAVPSKGFLWDLSTRLGRDDGANSDRAYYDSRYGAALSGPFALEDLPESWRAFAPSGAFHYYLLGKYEVSDRQWKAVMDGVCPPADGLTAGDALPRTEISWYDAVEFSRRYTVWLLENQPDALPRFQGDERNVGFVRLPTEAEWEYAARGGQNTPGRWLVEQDFFPMPNESSYADYAVFRPENAARIEEHPARIGSRRSNPVGLHDTAGNAAEMVMDVFRFSLGGRLHGSAGGFVRKGGSYLSGTAEIMPGRREEVAFFQVSGPVVARDMGFRLALSGINTPGGDRPEALRAEWERAGEEYALVLDDTRNPLEEMDRLLGMAQSDAERENFQRLRGILKDNNIALERQQALAAEALVRNAAFMIETIRNFSIRRNVADMQIGEMEKLAKSAQATAGFDARAPIARARTIRANLDRGFEQSLSFYRSSLDETRTVLPAILDAALAKVDAELAQGDEFSLKLRGNAAIYKSHVLALRRNQHSRLDKEHLLADIFPHK